MVLNETLKYKYWQIPYMEVWCKSVTRPILDIRDSISYVVIPLNRKQNERFLSWEKEELMIFLFKLSNVQILAMFLGSKTATWN